MHYNNQLTTIMTTNEQDMRAMNAAMTAGDYEKAGAVRQAWIRHLEKASRTVDGLGGYKGDYSFQKVVLAGLKNYKQAVAQDYKQLIAIRKQGARGQQARQSELLQTIDHTFIEAEKAIDKAAAVFQAQYEDQTTQSIY